MTGRLEALQELLDSFAVCDALRLRTAPGSSRTVRSGIVTSSSGTASTSFVVLPGPIGRYSVEAVGASGGFASTPFTRIAAPGNRRPTATVTSLASATATASEVPTMTPSATATSTAAPATATPTLAPTVEETAVVSETPAPSSTPTTVDPVGTPIGQTSAENQ